MTLSMLGVAAIALFLSTLTDSPLAAALGALGVLVASSLLLTLDAAHVARALPAHPLLAGVRRLLPRPDPVARHRARRAACRRVYVVVFLGAAWANFTTKDITELSTAASAVGRMPAAQSAGPSATRRPAQRRPAPIAMHQRVARAASPCATRESGADRLHGDVQRAVEAGGVRRRHGLVVRGPDRHPGGPAGVSSPALSRAQQVAVGASCWQPAGHAVGRQRAREPGQVGAVVRRAEGDHAAAPGRAPPSATQSRATTPPAE